MPRIRLQFSLRYLLLAVTLLSVAIVVYRWPWTVEVDKPRESRTTTQYRRGWNGKPVKDGLELEQDYRGPTWERWFTAGELQIERLREGRVITSEAHYQGGKLHGPYWAVGSERRADGEYRQDQMHGKWRFTSSDVIVNEEWQMGRRHGHRSWSTPDGRLLQSADYDNGSLVRWNDAPLSEELVRWLNAELPNSELSKRFLQPLQSPEEANGEHQAYFGEVMYFPGAGEFFSVHWDTRFPKYDLGRVGQPIGAAILASALENSWTLNCRFNSFYAVPITAKSLNWQDRTGVYDVQFEPGSQQAKAWLQFEEAHIAIDDPADRFQIMFRPTSETGITIDTSAIEHPEPESTDGILRRSLNLKYRALAKFSRRDLLGKHLDREGCYCEQHGNVLVIKRHK